MYLFSLPKCKHREQIPFHDSLNQNNQSYLLYSFCLYKDCFSLSLSLSCSLGLGGLLIWENPGLKFHPHPGLGSLSQITISLPWTLKFPILWTKKKKPILLTMISLSLPTYLSTAVGLAIYTIASREPTLFIAMRSAPPQRSQSPVNLSISLSQQQHS